MSFRFRRRVPELMDQPGLSEQMHQQALCGLHRVNWLSRSCEILWPSILELAEHLDRRPLRILDIASGGGDVTLRMARRAKRVGIDVEVDGCDVNRFAVMHARRQALAARVNTVGFFELDALTGPLPDDYDVVMCSLFLHHLDESNAARLLRRMSAAARHLVLVNDLRRTRTGYLLAWVGCRLLTRSRIVHADGPLSVAAAFTIDEVSEVAQQAGLAHAAVSRHWPQRFLLTWRRTS